MAKREGTQGEELPAGAGLEGVSLEEERELAKRETPNSIMELRFAKAYLEKGDGVAAARAAGYAGSNLALSKKAQSLLNREGVHGYLVSQMKDVMSAEEAAARLSSLARGTIGHFIDVDKDGQPKLNLAKPGAMDNLHLIREIVPTKHGAGIKIYSQLDALKTIATLYKIGSREDLQRKQVEQLLAILPPELQAAVQQHMAAAVGASALPSCAAVEAVVEAEDEGWIRDLESGIDIFGVDAELALDNESDGDAEE